MRMISTLLMTAMLWGTILRADPVDAPTFSFTPPSYTGFQWVAENTFGVYLLQIDDGGAVRDIMMYRGDITENSTDIVKFFLDQYPNIDEIALNSPGGIAFESFKLGEYFSDKHLRVTVPPGAICLSACAFAFIGGSSYRIDGVLGFHTAYIDIPKNTFDLSNLNDAYREGQFTGSEVMKWFLINGFTGDFVEQIIAKTSQDKFITFTNEHDLLKFYVRNDAVKSDIDGMLKYLVPTDGTSIDPTIMTGDECMAWVSANPDPQHRGRKILAMKRLWPALLPSVHTNAQ